MNQRGGIDVTRFAPGLDQLRRYERSWLRPDLLGGLTVGAMLIPQSMAYAELAGMPPEAGFYAVLLALFAYAIFGSSRHLGVGPEPGTAILAATAVGGMAAGDPIRYAALMAALALVVAAVCLVAGLFRLGFLADLLSRPVLVGYITGIGLTLISSQIAKVTGIPIQEDGFFSRFAEMLSMLDTIDPATIAMGTASLALILALRRWPAVPGALIAVALATGVTALFSLAEHGIAVVGDIPAGLPALGLPGIAGSDMVALIPAALGIAVVGYSDNVLTARSISAERGYRIDSNQELLALGASNLMSGISQGFPISSSASRSFVPASIGTHTQLTSIVAAVFVTATLLFLRPVLANFPQAALGAVILAAAIAIIDVSGFRELWRLSRAEFLLAIAAALGVMIFDVLTGVLIAVALSAAVALWRIARPSDAVLGGASELDGWVAVDDFPTARPLPGLMVYRFDAPLFFANAEWFRERVEQALDINPGEEEWIIFDFDGIGSVDTTAVAMLEELLAELPSLGIHVVGIARANHDTIDRLQRAGLVAPDGAIRTFATINQAVAEFRSR
ncbi:MAG: sulfate permease [Acidimicrobiia bacterium]|nr:sulfate permease [Acidimicrobiia bacterium]